MTTELEKELAELREEKQAETEELIQKVNELRDALRTCWMLLPNGDYGSDGVSVKRYMTKFDCWPKGKNE